MCVEGASSKACDKCSLQGKDYCTKVCCDSFRSDNTMVHFNNKLIFSAEGIKLQIKRKGCKVKVKALEMSDGFDSIENDYFILYKSNIATSVGQYSLGIYEVGDKIKHTFGTEQEAIDWVDKLFSLRGD